ncbi:substrate-binding domain-containing protein [Synoicihabitans lomoniglobus]|uniref:Substrate-binding domain-containing protein n=1 Tax=Synoicihabitans lomoniglobus TaxID=2909285 RepID=A0AAE9ZT76_9BACT|nr:substrate-binding domain-containing protein [Opitutaceae bacterium LMO-M01]WED63687.1 substrate-binding domain-containing protein [Opitutaceae bacterium LMO-M01]
MISSPRIPIEIPTRRSLSSQAAAAIRKSIEEGTWEEFLPSERRLCTLFQVSRPTIRTALHLLAKEGLIDIRQGRRNRLLSRPTSSDRPRNQLVGLITHTPLSHMGLAAQLSIGTLRAHLAEQGFLTEVLVCPAGSGRVQQRKLESFVHQNRVFCCVVMSVSRDLQEWLARHNIPTLLLGSCHPDVSLPSLDFDYRSVCRHAAGVFLSKGHRRLALIVPHTGVAGDLASEAGFLEAVEQRPGSEDITTRVVRHNGSTKNIITKLDSLFNAKEPPTALLVAKPQYVWVVIIYLLKRGLAVPHDVSLMARDYDRIFETVSPPITHYGFSEATYAERLSRLMLQMVTQGYLSSEPILIFPKFFPGNTVRKLP